MVSGNLKPPMPTSYFKQDCPVTSQTPGDTLYTLIRTGQTKDKVKQGWTQGEKSTTSTLLYQRTKNHNRDKRTKQK